MAGWTSFLVAHRLGTILNADQILMMCQGQIVERGSHEEPVARNGFYARLARIQNMATVEKSFEKLGTSA